MSVKNYKPTQSSENPRFGCIDNTNHICVCFLILTFDGAVASLTRVHKTILCAVNAVACILAKYIFFLIT